MDTTFDDDNLHLHALNLLTLILRYLTFHRDMKDVPETEEAKYRAKCKELQRRIQEINQSNELLSLLLSRTNNSIRRLRLEYSILLERLEVNTVSLDFEMTSPPSPVTLDDKQKPVKRIKKVLPPTKAKIRDPNLPKRPTNAYLIFCELEKEKFKKESGNETLSNVQDLGKKLVENWKNLAADERKIYHKLFEDDKERYRKEMIVYNQRKKEEGDEPDDDTEEPEDIEMEEPRSEPPEEAVGSDILPTAQAKPVPIQPAPETNHPEIPTEIKRET